jgi:16S rRNA (cytidine1402-2'-O)-methyltransferase
MIFKPGLYIISTPIGNLGDITLRALEALKNSDIILCEDTRISKKLLVKHEIKTRLQIYNDHSNEDNRKKIFQLIDQGLVVSLVSDAGTPLISDPGYKLVKELRQLDYHVDVIPGACSPIVALTLSGMPTDRFLFVGFLPKTNEKRKKIFEEFIQVKATLIFFETAKRLVESLHSAYEVYGNRQICVARELTKLHQESKAGTITEIIEFYRLNPPRGEVVLLISGEEEKFDKQILNQKIEQFIRDCLSQGLTTRDTTQKAFTKFGTIYSKKEIYKIANKVKKNIAMS